VCTYDTPSLTLSFFLTVRIQTGNTALMSAALGGRVNIVALLLAREDIAVNVQNKVKHTQMTPLNGGKKVGK
jgi:ankyrin repeat protein